MPMGREVRRRYESTCAPERNLALLLDIHREAIARSAGIDVTGPGGRPW
jgi:hypothetical protein